MGGKMRPVLNKRLIMQFLILFSIVFIISAPSSASGTVTLITTQINGYNHQVPKISNDQIVWQDSDQATSSLGIIYLYNISSGVETQVTDSTTYTTNPAINGNFITYTDCNSDPFCGSGSTIYLYNITSGTRIPLSSEVDDYDNSAIYDNHVVWQNTSSISDITQIYIYNASSEISTQINPTGSNQLNPAIW